MTEANTRLHSMFFKTEVSGHWAKTPRNLEVVTRGGHRSLMPTSPRLRGGKQKTCIFHTLHSLLALQQTILSPPFPRGKPPADSAPTLRIAALRHEGTGDNTNFSFLTSLLLQQNLHKFCPKLQNVTISVTCPKHPQTTLQPRILYYISTII